MPDQNMNDELARSARGVPNGQECAMSLTQKLQALAKMAERGRESDVYAGIEYLLRTRPQPAYVGAIDDILAARDWPVWLASKGEPINV